MGLAVSDLYAQRPTRPLPGRAIYPPEHEEPLRELRVRKEDISAALLTEFVPALGEVDQDNDPRIALLAGALAQLYDEHLAITYGMEQEAWEFAAVCYRGMDAFVDFVRYSPFFHGPALERDREIYGGVWEAVWRACDLFLARLVELAGENATILLVTPRGLPALGDCVPAFPQRGENAALGWNQRQGIIVMKGPLLKQDILLHGAALIDFAPTILTLHGLPVGQDMEGRILIDAFRQYPAPAWLPSWESETGEFARHSEAKSPALWISAPTTAWERFRSQELWLRAQILLEDHALADAVLILEELHEREPEWDACASVLARSLIELELFPEAEEVVSLLESTSEPSTALLLRAHLALKQQYKTVCAQTLDQIEALPGTYIALWGWAGLIALGLRDTPRAIRLYEKCLTFAPEEPTALAGLAYCRNRERNYAAAEALAQRSIARTYSNFYGHFCLGIAHAHLGRSVAAVASFEMARRLHPGFLPAQRYLIHFYKQQLTPGSPAARELEWQSGILKTRFAEQRQRVRRRLSERRER